jgi:hypothetical protein
MGTRLYVGNLPFSADEEQVRDLFSRNGRNVVEVKLVTDRDTGRPAPSEISTDRSSAAARSLSTRRASAPRVAVVAGTAAEVVTEVAAAGAVAAVDTAAVADASNTTT